MVGSVTTRSRPGIGTGIDARRWDGGTSGELAPVRALRLVGGAGTTDARPGSRPGIRAQLRHGLGARPEPAVVVPGPRQRTAPGRPVGRGRGRAGRDRPRHVAPEDRAAGGAGG